jgi:hypothetical protein
MPADGMNASITVKAIANSSRMIGQKRLLMRRRAHDPERES